MTAVYAVIAWAAIVMFYDRVLNVFWYPSWLADVLPAWLPDGFPAWLFV